MTSTDPKAVDSQLAEIGGQIAAQDRILDGLADIWHRGARDTHVATSYSRRRWTMTDGAAEREARQLEADSPTGRENVRRAITIADAAREEIKRLGALYAETEAPYRAQPWTRYFLVTSSNGHIHSSTRCSTCHPTTQFGWLTDMSGDEIKATVDKHGALLCTVCYPDAPVEWTNGRELEAAAKAAESCPGSKTYDYDRATARMGYVTGNAGTCNHCKQRVTLTSAGKLRGHTPATK